MIPSVGRIVHYVSYGTPGGEYTSECRAAIVTEVPTYPEGDDRNGNVVGLAVFNPTGVFLNCELSYSQDTRVGGTWHWPEKVPQEEQ